MNAAPPSSAAAYVRHLLSQQQQQQQQRERQRRGSSASASTSSTASGAASPVFPASAGGGPINSDSSASTLSAPSPAAPGFIDTNYNFSQQSLGVALLLSVSTSGAGDSEYRDQLRAGLSIPLHPAPISGLQVVTEQLPLHEQQQQQQQQQQHQQQSAPTSPSKRLRTSSTTSAVPSSTHSPSVGSTTTHLQQQQQQQKTFPCLFPGCFKVFPRAYNLKSHSYCHSGERPHQCSACNASFSRKHDLQRHVRTLHGKGRNFSCATCSQSFTTNDQLRRHTAAEGHLIEERRQNSSSSNNDTTSQEDTLQPTTAQPAVRSTREHLSRRRNSTDGHEQNMYQSIHAAATAADWTTSQLLNLAAAQHASASPSRSASPISQLYTQPHFQQFYQQQQRDSGEQQQEQQELQSDHQYLPNFRSTSDASTRQTPLLSQQQQSPPLDSIGSQPPQQQQQQQTQGHSFDVNEYVLSRFESQKQRRASGTTGGGIGFLALAAEAEVEMRKQMGGGSAGVSEDEGGGGSGGGTNSRGGTAKLEVEGNESLLLEGLLGNECGAAADGMGAEDSESLEYLLDVMKAQGGSTV